MLASVSNKSSKIKAVKTTAAGQSHYLPVVLASLLNYNGTAEINKEEDRMTAQEELEKYITELTPEKLETLIDRLPQLISELAAQGLPVPPSESLRKQ